MSNQEQKLLGKEIRKTIHLSPIQLQIVYGGLLGDGNIQQRKNGSCRFKISHGEKQLDYLEFKKKLLEPFIIQEKPTLDFQPNNPYGSITFYTYSTIVHQDFTNIFGILYRNFNSKRKKYISMNMLKRLQPLSILIWFLDDGCYHYDKTKKSHKLYLSSYRYSLSEHQVLKKWFWKKWKIESVITYDSTHKLYYLRFNIEGLKLFNNIFLKPYKDMVPSCMHHKFPNL